MFLRSALLAAACAQCTAFSVQPSMPTQLRLGNNAATRNPLPTISMSGSDFENKIAFNRRDLLQKVAQSSIAAAILGPVGAKVANAISLEEVETEQVRSSPIPRPRNRSCIPLARRLHSLAALPKFNRSLQFHCSITTHR